MNSTASAVMTCAVAERATIDTDPPHPVWGERGWPGDHGEIDRGPMAGLPGDPMTRFPARSKSARRWYGGGLSSRKTVSPPFRPPTYPQLTAPHHTEPGRLPELPAMVVAEGQATERIVGEEQIPVEVDPVRERSHGGRRGDRDRGLLHAAEERPEPELVRPREHLR